MGGGRELRVCSAHAPEPHCGDPAEAVLSWRQRSSWPFACCSLPPCSAAATLATRTQCRRSLHPVLGRPAPRIRAATFHSAKEVKEQRRGRTWRAAEGTPAGNLNLCVFPIHERKNRSLPASDLQKGDEYLLPIVKGIQTLFSA